MLEAHTSVLCVENLKVEELVQVTAIDPFPFVVAANAEGDAGVAIIGALTKLPSLSKIAVSSELLIFPTKKALSLCSVAVTCTSPLD